VRRDWRQCAAFGLGAVLLAPWGGAEGADAQAEAAPAGQQEQVLITGHLEEDLPIDLSHYGTRVDVVTAEQIRNGGFLDVAGALQSLVPGLYISPKNGPFDYADISLQGSRTSDVLWLVDGVRINNRLYGSTPPLDTLPAPMVERVVVLEGPEALFYGTQGVAGAINVITRDFTPTPDGQVAIGGDTNSSRHVDAYFSDTLGGQRFVLFGSSDHSQGFQPFRTQDYQPSATAHDRSFDSGTVGLKYAIEPLDDLRFSATFMHTQGRLDDSAPQRVAVAYNQRNENILTGKLDYTAGDQVQLFVKGYLHQWHSHFTEYDNDLETPGTFDTIDDHDFWGYNDAGGTATVKLALNKGFEYYLGADYQAYSGSDAVLVITQKHERVQAYFGEVASTPELLANARFAAGFRYNDSSFGPSATVWSASGKIDLPQRLYVRALVGTAFRLPSAEELFANDPEDERGNPDLKPEKSTNANFSIGGAAADARLSWELIGFVRNIEDLISFDGFDPATDQSLAANVPGEVRVRGGEVTLHAVLDDSFTASASYTYSHARQAGNQQIARIPEQNAQAVLDFHPLGGRVGATLSLNYVGKVHQSVWDGAEPYGNYVVPDLAARWFVDSARHHLITARLQNVLDKEYATSIGSATRDSDGSNYTYWNLGVPRTFELRYTYHF
jgi:outer membrane cobalamin receptor